jgi:D-alanyl-D-alanine carboxypeptidase (penicillin-binding protein 5/6)
MAPPNVTPRRNVLRRLLLLPAVVVALSTGPAALAAPKPPPPTPVPVPCSSASGVCSSPSPFPTELHTPPPSTKPPEISARAAIVEDLTTGQVLYAHDPDVEHPLASTTKIMTALLVLERSNPGDEVTVGADAAAEGSAGAGFSELGLREGERRTVGELLFALMLQSSNDAAIALADHVSGSEDAFVRAMNARARAMGLRHTVFFSSNGLDDRGHSTAREMAAITREAMARPEFADVVGRKFDTIPAPEGPSRRVQNRNVLLWLYRGATGVKTGYTSAAGFCLVATAERQGRGVVAVVLDAPSTEDSFDDAAALLDYGYTGYSVHTLVRQGQDFRPVPVGTQQIPVEAGAGLARLLPEPAGRVVRRITILPGLRLPVESGERVGTVAFRAGRLPVGSVPLVASGPPAGERGNGEGPAPWWIRGLGSLARFSFDTVFGLFG